MINEHIFFPTYFFIVERNHTNQIKNCKKNEQNPKKNNGKPKNDKWCTTRIINQTSDFNDFTGNFQCSVNTFSALDHHDQCENENDDFFEKILWQQLHHSIAHLKKFSYPSSFFVALCEFCMKIIFFLSTNRWAVKIVLFCLDMWDRASSFGMRRRWQARCQLREMWADDDLISYVFALM